MLHLPLLLLMLLALPFLLLLLLVLPLLLLQQSSFPELSPLLAQPLLRLVHFPHCP